MTQDAVQPIGSVDKGTPPPPEITFADVQKKIEASGTTATAAASGAVSAEQVRITDINQLMTDPALKPIYDALLEWFSENIRSYMQRSNERIKQILQEEERKHKGG